MTLLRDEDGARWRGSIYEPGENGKLLGISDRNNRQVLWFEYDGGGNLRAARDLTASGRYTYTDGRLSRVRDVLGKDTLYSYDPKGGSRGSSMRQDGSASLPMTPTGICSVP